MLAEILIPRIKWAQFADINGSAHNTGAALAELLASEDPGACRTAYWKIENRVVVQGTVYDAAEPLTRVLVAALADSRPIWVRASILEILFQILSGAAEPELGFDVVERCREVAAEGELLVAREFVFGETEAAGRVLGLISSNFDYDLFRRVGDQHCET